MREESKWNHLIVAVEIDFVAEGMGTEIESICSGHCSQRDWEHCSKRELRGCWRWGYWRKDRVMGVDCVGTWHWNDASFVALC